MRSFLALLVTAAALAAPAAAGAADSAAILMYHRFGEDSYPSTNIRIEQFEEHLRELTSGSYTVLPISEILAAIRSGRELPDRTVGITIDDAYLSVYTQAWPRLKKAGLPFALFVSTDGVDKGFTSMLNWDQIRDMRAAGVEIGAHSASHLHMADASTELNRAEMELSLKRFKEELGEKPALFAFPYGEAGLAERQIVAEFGFETAFGQHSGVVHASAPPLYLPRFAVNEAYGGMDEFRLRVNALPLPVSDMLPKDSVVKEKNPPAMGFTVDPSVPSLTGMACYHSQFGRVEFQILGARRVEIRFPGPFKTGRSRINCTKPAGKGRWLWFGTQFYTPS